MIYQWLKDLTYGKDVPIFKKMQDKDTLHSLKDTIYCIKVKQDDLLRGKC